MSSVDVSNRDIKFGQNADDMLKGYLMRQHGVEPHDPIQPSTQQSGLELYPRLWEQVVETRKMVMLSVILEKISGQFSGVRWGKSGELFWGGGVRRAFAWFP